MNTKICYKCKIEKSVSEFHKNCRKLDGYDYLCKECRKENAAKYYKANKDKINKQNKNYYEFHKVEVYKRTSQYAKDNKELIKKFKKNFYNNHPHYDRDYIRKKSKTDINFRIKKNLSRRILLALDQNWKSGHTLELLGCSIDYFRQHLENKFTDGMNWDNYGKQGWVLDHIYPCISFDLSKSEEQKICFHWSNYQPLWEFDNLSKGSKIL